MCCIHFLLVTLRANPYSTPYVVWADKTGRLPEREDTEATRQGRDLEDYVAKRFTEQTGKAVRRKNKIIRNPKYPFAHANIDRAVVGESAGLECKTTGVLNLKRFKNGEYPEEYYCQCIHYMAVTGFEKWYLAVLVLSQGFTVYEIERDEDEIKALMDAEKEFWDTYVLADVPPPVDGMKATTDAINKVFGATHENEVDISHLTNDIENLQVLKSQIKTLDTQAEQIEQKIKVELGENTGGYSDKFKVTWLEQSRRTLDRKLITGAFPKIDLSPYEKISRFRTLRIKEAN